MASVIPLKRLDLGQLVIERVFSNNSSDIGCFFKVKYRAWKLAPCFQICYARFCMLFIYLFYISIMLIGWALVFPLQTIEKIWNLKQRLYHFIIEYMIKKDIQLLMERYRKWAKHEGYELRLSDEVLDKYMPKMIKRLEGFYSQVSSDELVP